MVLQSANVHPAVCTKFNPIRILPRLILAEVAEAWFRGIHLTLPGAYGHHLSTPRSLRVWPISFKSKNPSASGSGL